MNGDKFQEWMNSVDPEEAASTMTTALRNLFQVLSRDTKVKLVMDLFGRSSWSKVGSMGHL